MEGWKVVPFPIDNALDGHDKACGPRRNRRMLTQGRPAALLAFPGWRGTADCVKAAKSLNIPVYLIHVLPQHAID